MNFDILDRLSAANPTPDESVPPRDLWSEAVLRQAVEAGLATSQPTDADSNPGGFGARGVLVALGAFALVMAVGVAGFMVTRGSPDSGAVIEGETAQVDEVPVQRVEQEDTEQKEIEQENAVRPAEDGGAVAELFSPEPGEDSWSLGPPIDASGAVWNFSTTAPDFAGAVAGDDGGGRLPLGVVTELPGEDYLNFLFEFCQPECYRDAHFMDPADPRVGSGPWTAGRPFHVRHGFINNGAEPLGDGFDVVMYVTRWGEGPESDAFVVGQTYRFTSDFVLRGTSDECGPTYKTQEGAETCEWFVHDFPDGLPEGRYDLWAVWEAPCSAWVDMGFTEACDDPGQVMSLFSAGVNSPFGDFPPSFTELNEAKLHLEQP